MPDASWVFLGFSPEQNGVFLNFLCLYPEQAAGEFAHRESYFASTSHVSGKEITFKQVCFFCHTSNPVVPKNLNAENKREYFVL